jgi:hypothetical protein
LCEKEFEGLLVLEEDYECLIQINYLKHLMENKSEALAYAFQPKNLKSAKIKYSLGYGAFNLGFKALLHEYN